MRKSKWLKVSRRIREILERRHWVKTEFAKQVERLVVWTLTVQSDQMCKGVLDHLLLPWLPLTRNLFRRYQPTLLEEGKMTSGRRLCQQNPDIQPFWSEGWRVQALSKAQLDIFIFRRDREQGHWELFLCAQQTVPMDAPVSRSLKERH